MRSVNKKEAALGFLFFYFGLIYILLLQNKIAIWFLGQYLFQYIGRAYIAKTLYV